MVTLLIATRNAHKVGEIRAILGEGFHYLTLNDVPNAPEVIEDAGTFAGNATKKAVALAKWLGEARRLESMNRLGARLGARTATQKLSCALHVPILRKGFARWASLML